MGSSDTDAPRNGRTTPEKENQNVNMEVRSKMATDRLRRSGSYEAPLSLTEDRVAGSWGACEAREREKPYLDRESAREATDVTPTKDETIVSGEQAARQTSLRSCRETERSDEKVHVYVNPQIVHVYSIQRSVPIAYCCALH